MHALRSPHTTLVAAITCGALALGGCNLAINLDDYPYQGVVADLSAPDLPVVEDMPEDMPVVEDMPEDMRIPIGPVPTPDVIITEVMVDTSSPEGSSTLEPGEYIELYNRGPLPALTSRLFLELDLVTNNKVFIPNTAIPAPPSAIQPGEFFVFVRSDDADYGVVPHIATNRYYNWGDLNSSLALSNSGRTVSVKYRVDLQDPSKDELLDQVSWFRGRLPEPGEQAEVMGLNIQENLSISLRADQYNATIARRAEPASWCYDQSASLGMVGLLGSPGKMPITERCTDTADPLDQ